VNSWEAADVADEVLFDGQLAKQAIVELNRTQNRPFFLAVGFFRPHLPFIAPRRYFDLYPEDSLQLPGRQYRPEASPECAVHRSPELRTYVDISKSDELSREKQESLLLAYYAAVSYVDAQIGRVLGELDRLHLRERTIVVLWSDHGYHLGDHGLWGKATDFEEAVRSTLIVSAAGIPTARTRGLVELVDLYPSLCELCGLPQPERLEGTSFVPLMRSPGRAWKSAVFSQASPRKAEGFSMRTDRYRYTEWRRDGRIVATELYDREVDPDETRNTAPTADPGLLDRLQTQLRIGWKAARSSDTASTHP
jgi:arylsulfatase A-like enzyme